MSGANYAHCEVCGMKACYTGDADYGDAEYAALCPSCARDYKLIAIPS